jgi:hypothetical protein
VYNIESNDPYCVLHCIAEHFIPLPKRISLCTPRLKFAECRENGQRITSSTFLRRDELTFRDCFLTSPVPRTIEKMDVEVREKFLAGSQLFRSGLKEKFLTASSFLDEIRTVEDDTYLDISNLSYFEALFEIRILCLGCSMTVKDESEPMYINKGRRDCIIKKINKKRYNIGEVTLLHTPHKVPAKYPLVCLYYLTTNERSNGTDSIYMSRKLKDRSRYIPKRQKARERYCFSELDREVNAHFLYIPMEGISAMCSKLLGGISCRLCPICLNVVKCNGCIIVLNYVYSEHLAQCKTMYQDGQVAESANNILKVYSETQ